MVRCGTRVPARVKRGCDRWRGWGCGMPRLELDAGRLYRRSREHIPE